MKRFDAHFAALSRLPRTGFVVPPIVLQLAKDPKWANSTSDLCAVVPAAAPLSAELETAVTDRLGVKEA